MGLCDNLPLINENCCYLMQLVKGSQTRPVHKQQEAHPERNL